MTKNTSTPCTKYHIPKKNINKLNTKGETQLHIACLKVNLLDLMIN